MDAVDPAFRATEAFDRYRYMKDGRAAAADEPGARPVRVMPSGGRAGRGVRDAIAALPPRVGKAKFQVAYVVLGLRGIRESGRAEFSDADAYAAYSRASCERYRKQWPYVRRVLVRYGKALGVRRTDRRPGWEFTK